MILIFGIKYEIILSDFIREQIISEFLLLIDTYRNFAIKNYLGIKEISIF